MTCPRCGHQKVWDIRRNRHRCARCRYDWRPGPPLRLSEGEWEKILGAYVRGKKVQEIARETGFHRQRILRALSLLRSRLFDSLLKEPASPHLKNGHDASGRPLVWGALRSDGKVWARLVLDSESPEMLSELEALTKKRKIVHSDVWSVAEGPVATHLKHLHFNGNDGKIGPTRALQAFWTYVSKSKISAKRLDGRRLNLRLAEIVWRYNNRASTHKNRIGRLMRLIKQPLEARS